MEHIRDYSYIPLSDPSRELRLVMLLPASNFEDPICVTISKVAFLPPSEPPVCKKQLSIAQIRQTLPQGWVVDENLEGRCIFRGSKGQRQWRHPDPTVKQELYSLDLDNWTSDFEPRYEAISYVWGSPQANQEMIFVRACCQDASCGSLLNHSQTLEKLQIRPNLACALRHLRADAPRTLWIDAISISQADIDERNEQVKVMGSIFGLADRVIVWLGPDYSNSSLALSTLEYLGKQVEHTEDHRLASPDAVEPLWFRSKQNLPYTAPQWHAIESLLSREWWSRVWTVQEIQLANHRALFKSGNYEISAHLLIRAIWTLAAKTNIPNIRKGVLFDAQAAIHGSTQKPLIHTLGSISRGRQCTDPRDKLYGVLNLIGSSMVCRIEPRYSVSVPDVYCDFFLAYLNSVHRLDLLPHAGPISSQNICSTWVPDWSMPASFELLRSYCLSAAGQSRAHAQIFLDRKVLEVSGIHITTIVSVSCSWEDYVRDVCGREGVDRKGGPEAEYVGGGTCLDACVRLIRVRYDSEDFHKSFDSQGFEKGRYLLLNFLSNLAHPQWNVEHLDSCEYITTMEGHIGLVPKGTKSHDRICVLLGCHLPMILRPENHRKDSEPVYSVVGSCFIPGLMRAEGFLGLLPPPWKFYSDYIYGWPRFRFIKTDTQEISDDDPRLPPLSSEWKRIHAKRTSNDPLHFAYFKNKVTGEIMNSDPRMLPEVLEKMGVKLETFRLI